MLLLLFLGVLCLGWLFVCLCLSCSCLFLLCLDCSCFPRVLICWSIVFEYVVAAVLGCVVSLLVVGLFMFGVLLFVSIVFVCSFVSP